MAGRLVYVAGPSGSGKDSVLDALARTLPAGCVIMPRVMTRRGAQDDDGADTLDDASFVRQQADGAFALSWQAHGLRYGIRRDLDTHLAQGRLALVNGSRAHWREARQRYPDAALVWLTVAPDLLLARLRGRGRETEAQIQQRLQRNAQMARQLDDPAMAGVDVLVLDNSGMLDAAVQRLRAQLVRWMPPSGQARDHQESLA